MFKGMIASQEYTGMEESKECYQNPRERASHSEEEVASWGRYWEGSVSQLEYKER